MPEEERNTLSSPSELDIAHWWLAQIVDCCVLDGNGQAGNGLGFLKIRWFYNLSQLLSSQQELAKPYKRQLSKYRFKPYEVGIFVFAPKSMARLTSKVKFIFSDHYDFIGLETYAGHAPGFFAWIEIKGLAVPDEQILLPLDDRKGKYGMRWIEVSLLPMLAGLSHRL